MIFKYKGIASVQEWLPIENIFDNGVIKLKDKSYIKIIKIIPINYNLKSEFEKEAILNSYKIFLKTCNFDLQILIQSNKEDLSKHISSVNNFTKKENNNIKKLSEEYIKYLNELNINKKSATKNFYIIIKKEKNKNNNIENINKYENLIFEELNDNYLKIKDSLSRCGNLVIDINDKKICKEILFSFFCPKKIKIGGDN
ncbi:MAG: hypothetical protein E7313_05385 [Clostridiales bacterium]|nr:hypothetical protein [Clostridiales bacterium]